MAISFGQLYLDAWDEVMTLARYGREPMTVGWWKGRAYVRIWDYRKGYTVWRPFSTTRTETPPPSGDDFSSRFLWDALR